GDLQVETTRIQSCLTQGIANLIGQIGLRELPWRDVYIDGEGRIRGKERLPGTDLPAGVIKQLPVDGQDDAGLIRHRDELPRHDQTFRTLPTTQCLEPHDLAVAQRYNGLVENAELVQLECFAQVGFELQTFDGTRVHGMVEHLTAGLTSALGAIHGNLGIAEYFLRVH